MKELEPINPSEFEPFYDYTIDLDSSDYRIYLYWLDRTESWYINLYDENDVLLIGGIRLSIDNPLFVRHTGRRPENGFLMLVDIDGSGVECGYEDLGHRCKLVWIDTDDIDAEIQTDPYIVSYEDI